MWIAFDPAHLIKDQDHSPLDGEGQLHGSCLKLNVE